MRTPLSGLILLVAFGLSACANEGSDPSAAESAQAPEPARQPNIIVILADDLGYADISTYGDRVATPNIDRIGKKGAIFEQGYVTTPVCSPSRAALVTGRYQQRYGFEHNARESPEVPDVGLIAGELTIADHLKRAGYATGIVGKWHLGFKDEHYPTHRGFDEFYGHLSGATQFVNVLSQGVHSMAFDDELRARPPEDPRTDLLVRGSEPLSPPNRSGGNQIVEGPERTVREVAEYITDVFGERSVDFISRHKDEPFFLYSAFNAPHSPFQVTQEYYDRFPDEKNELLRIYFGMIAALDDAVGRILDTLEENGLADNTLVVFLGDNGCAGYVPGLCSCEPLSGGKATFYEGGVRVPFLMRWPQAIEAGSRVTTPVSSLDILPTAIAAAGQTAPEGLALDGHNLLPLFEEGGGGSHHDRLVFRMSPAIAVRQGDMKLIKPNQDEPLGFLYDLSVDVREQNNLADERPEVIQSLEEEIEDWRSITAEPLWGPRPPLTYSICGIEPIGFEV